MLYIAVVFRFWLKLLGPKVFWALMALSTAVAVVLNYKL